MTPFARLSPVTSDYYHLIRHISADIRCKAIQHLGQLLKDMSQDKWMLKKVTSEVLVALLLFGEDTEIVVAKACKDTLGICSFQLHWNLGHLLQNKHLNDQLVVPNTCPDF